MTSLVETGHAGGFLLSEANGTYSRETVTIASGQNLLAGAVLGKKTSGGAYAAYDSNLSDGTQTAVAILLDDCNATGGAKKATVIVRAAEVNGDELVYLDDSPAVDEAGAVTDLASVGIIVR